MTRLAILASHPIQYQAPLYRRLASSIELKVFFCWEFGISPHYDRGFGRHIAWDVELLDGYESTFLENRSRDAGTHHFFGLSNPLAARAISSWQPDALIVHGYNHWTTWQVVTSCIRKGVPILMRGESNLLRQPSPAKAFMKSAILRRLFRRLSGAVAIGSLNREFYRFYGMPVDRIFMAPYTVDNNFFISRKSTAVIEARALREGLGLAGTPTVVFAAKLIRKKACADLIAAISTIDRRRRPALIVIGDGDQRETLRQQASACGVDARFLGFLNQTEMPAGYLLGDVFVLPSHEEPWGLAVNEAMCLGLPVIVSDKVGSAVDLISADTGWTFPAGCVGGLADTIVAAFEADRTSMSAAAAQRMTQWSIESTARGFVEAVHATVHADPVDLSQS